MKGYLQNSIFKMDQILFYTEINKECTDEKLILGNKGIH